MFQKVVIFDYTETEKGAWFKCHIPGWYAPKKIIQKWMSALIKFDDGRGISAKQNRLIHAMIGDIALYYGYSPVEKKIVKEQLKHDFAIDYDIEPFSVGKLDMTTANDFIDYIINFMLLWDIEMSSKVNLMARTTNNWIYHHIMNGKCVCCQKDKKVIGIHLHHTNPVGMGRNRQKVDHSKHKFLTLCGIHHSEAHNIGQQTFNEKYHIDGIELSKESLVELRLMNKCDLKELDGLESEVGGKEGVL